MPEKFSDVDAKTEEEQLEFQRLREQFREAGPDELRRRFATIWLGPELATKIYGPEPDPPTRPFPIEILWWPYRP